MDKREELVERLWEAWAYAEEACGCTACSDCPAYPKNARCMTALAADHMIDHGVTVKVKNEKLPVDLTNKCGSCKHSELAENVFGKSKCYVRCTNKEHLSSRRYQGRPLIAVRQRTAKACKRYEPKGE